MSGEPRTMPRRVFQDCISIGIPLNVTADLAVAIKKTREKRIKTIYQVYPSLNKNHHSKGDADDDKEQLDSEDDEDNRSRDKEKPTSTSTSHKDNNNNKKLQNGDPMIPNREQYGNVIDYLEAKYVRGVALQEDLDFDDDEEGGGSVYDSESSFLDDSLIKRDVTEQLLSQTTHTKLELENQAEDDFFVNVGDLEVAEHDLMNYDPVADDKEQKKPSKRKRPASSTENKPSASAAKKSKATGKKSLENTAKNGAAAKLDKKSTGKGPATKALSAEFKANLETLKQLAKDLKADSDQQFQKMADAINNFTDVELPRRKKTDKVTVVVPEGKKKGDDITFANPHVPGQKLRVKIPSAIQNNKFVVSVPVPPKENPDDNNKWSRMNQDLLDDFSQAFDKWSTAEQEWRDADPSFEKNSFSAHKEKLVKFEKLVPLFPKDLETPVDAAYLRKIVRRARQNRAKREKTAKKLEEDGIPAVAEVAKTSQPPKEKPPDPVETARELALPGKGSLFATIPAPTNPC